MISHHIAMVYAMVVGAAADGSLAERELETIRGIVEGLPIFDEFEKGNLAQIAAAATELLTEEDGIDTAIDQITEVAQNRVMNSNDRKEGAAAFADRREVDWPGS